MGVYGNVSLKRADATLLLAAQQGTPKADNAHAVLRFTGSGTLASIHRRAGWAAGYLEGELVTG